MLGEIKPKVNASLEEERFRNEVKHDLFFCYADTVILCLAGLVTFNLFFLL